MRDLRLRGAEDGRVIGNILLFGLLLGSLVLTVFISSRVHRPPHTLLAAIAGRWKGTVHSGGLFSGTWIEIRIGDVAGKVTFADAGWTRLWLDWPTETRVRVIPEGFGTRLRRLIGGREINFDDPYFDDRFWVESSHPVWARDVLEVPVRRGLVALSRRPDGDVTLDIGPAGILLRVTRDIVDDPNALGSFIELGVAVLMKARGLAEAAGVKLEAVHARSGSACPICGHPVTDARRACPSCRTPHHRDCWTYLGGCAIFACASRRTSR